jgi:hypothetical protein
MEASINAPSYIKVLDDIEKNHMKLTKNRLMYHHKLIILFEIVSDVKLYSHMGDIESAKDY